MGQALIAKAVFKSGKEKLAEAETKYAELTEADNESE
jgi:hypothetical protein